MKHLSAYFGTLVALLVAGVATALADTIYAPGEQNRLWIDDSATNGATLAAGDFNGDGRRDIALHTTTPGPQGSSLYAIDVISDNGEETLSASRLFRIEGPRIHNVAAGDVNGDGIDDLIFSLNPTALGPSTVNGLRIYFGRPTPPPLVDMNTETADVSIVSSSPTALTVSPTALAIGDVTGDQVADIAVGLGQSDRLLLIPGGGWLQRGLTLDAYTDTRCHHILGKSGSRLGWHVQIATLDGDGIDDLLVSANNDVTALGDFYVFRGTTTFPSSWNVNSRAPDLTALGATGAYVRAEEARDFDGDGVADPVLRLSDFANSSSTIAWTSGADLMALAPTADLRTAAVALHPFSFLKPFAGWFGVVNSYYTLGDFDGDGRADILGLGPGSNRTVGLPEALHMLLSPATRWDGGPYPGQGDLIAQTPSYSSFFLTDLNRDGRDDLVLYLPPYEHYDKAPYATYGELMVIDGYRPLVSPAVQAQRRGDGSLRAMLSLSVGGDPVEMQLDGDIDPAMKNRWIPFQPSLGVDLVDGVGTRTVRAMFRNASQRTSDWAEATVTLQADGRAFTPVTTHSRGGQPLRLDVQLDVPARVVACVYDRRGIPIRSLRDEDLSAGVHAIAWDTRDEDGRTVAPGLYFIRTDVDGVGHRTRVTVEP